MILKIICLSARIALAGIFLVSGGEKLLSPRENFLFVIQNYQVVPYPFLEQAVALVFPWLEFAVGGLLLLGLWTRAALWAAAMMSTAFIVIVGQAIIRNLAISSCGCFGDLVKVPLPVIIIMDSVILLTAMLLLKNIRATVILSLDEWCERRGSGQRQD